MPDNIPVPPPPPPRSNKPVPPAAPKPNANPGVPPPGANPIPSTLLPLAFVVALFAGLILTYPTIYYFVYPHARYRHPIEPELLILIVFLVSQTGRREALTTGVRATSTSESAKSR